MKNSILYIIFILPLFVFSQQKDNHLPNGNAQFENKQYTEAEAEYRMSLSENPGKAIASYNLGTTIYKQKQSAESKFAFSKTIENATNRSEKHNAFHNLGNVFMNEKNYSAAVEAYKNALRNNPADEQTRYNYALAKKFLKENPPKKDDNKNKKDKKKENKKEKDKDDNNKGNNDKDKDKGDNKENKDKKGDQEKNSNKNSGDNEAKPKPKPGGISKQRVENLLDAVNNEEKKIQDKVNVKKLKGKPIQTEKDW
jgi:tetratricopeptide (TPR) repeat protein